MPMKILENYFVDVNKLILNFIWTGKRLNTILKENNKVEGLILPNLKTYNKVIVIKTGLYWQKKDQCNRVESPEIDPHKYSGF